MKQIRVWKVALLTLLTGGIYGIAWLINRRDELVKHTKTSLPSDEWLIAAVVALIVSLTSIFMVGVLYVFNLLNPVLSMVLGAAVLIATIAYLVGWWWIDRFGSAIAKLTAGRVPLWWTMLFYILMPLAIPPVYQYYINRSGNTSSKVTGRPGRRFRFISITAASLLVLVNVASWYTLPSDLAELEKTKQEFSNTIPATAEEEIRLNEEAERLHRKYAKCILQLEQEYPESELLPEQVDAYYDAEDACEEIRLEQNTIIDKLDGWQG